MLFWLCFFHTTQFHPHCHFLSHLKMLINLGLNPFASALSSELQILYLTAYWIPLWYSASPERLPTIPLETQYIQNRLHCHLFNPWLQFSWICHFNEWHTITYVPKIWTLPTPLVPRVKIFLYFKIFTFSYRFQNHQVKLYKKILLRILSKWHSVYRFIWGELKS